MRSVGGFAAAFVLLLAWANSAQGQRAILRGLPIPTVIVLHKPGPEEQIGERRTIRLGIKDKTYSFVLKDAYVDSPDLIWEDVWRSIERSQPNMQLQGPNDDRVANLRPGETVAVSGMYAPITRTFEVTNVEQGSGPTEPPKHY